MNHSLSFFCLSLFFFLSLSTACSESSSTLKTIYNTDSRKPLHSSPDLELQRFAGSVALVIPAFRADFSAEHEVTVKADTAGNIFGMCRDEPFRDDLMIGNCTGFLISDTQLITAGHCIEKDSQCTEKLFLFGNTSSQTAVFPRSDIYSCRKVIHRVEKDSGDLVLIELDRAVASAPETRRFSMAPITSLALADVRPELVTLGHPLGAGMKMAPLEKLISAGPESVFLNAEIDVSQGASGSPLFSPASGIVYGVLTGGMSDFEWDPTSSCVRNKICRGSDCAGETFAHGKALARLLDN